MIRAPLSYQSSRSSERPAPARVQTLQRKCACGGTPGPSGECAECRKKRASGNARRSTQPSAINHQSAEVPSIVHEVLRSPGQPLDAAARVFMEPRFGHNFSRVRIHTDAQAAESARAVNALAYTVGSHIVFGSNQFSWRAHANQRLLAHELTHVVQQENTPATEAPAEPEIAPVDDVSERQATKVAASDGFSEAPGITAADGKLLQRSPDDGSDRHGSTLPYHEATELAECIRIMGEQNAAYCSQEVLGERITPPAPPVVPSSAAACFAPLCAQVSRPPVPSTDAAAQSRGNEWLAGALSCLQSSSAGAKASHGPEIIANEEAELRAEVDQINGNLTSGRRGRSTYRYYLSGLEELCRRKTREIGIEFKYNVVFENQPGGLQWGFSDADWDSVEGALAALPAEATTGNPQLLRFRREECHPDDVDPSTGQCVGHGGGFTGGEANAATGVITVYSRGLGTTPYTRSAGIGLSATAQTIRHEVGHTIQPQVARSDRDDFFENVVHWHQYQGPGHVDWPRERLRLRTELGLDDPQLSTWLAGLASGRPVQQDPRTYIKHQITPTYFTVESFESAQVPAGREFDYARTARDEYFAEIYAFAVSRPEFLDRVLPDAQKAWLKRVVFHTPENLRQLAFQAALADPARTEFVVRGSRLFTREQLDALLTEVTTQTRQPGTQFA